MLLRLREISSKPSCTIQKARKYIKRGQRPPKGVMIRRGKRGGMYYETSSHITSSPVEFTSYETPTAKRIVHDHDNVISEEELERDLEENGIEHNGRKYIDRKVKIGGMEVVINHDKRDPDSPLRYKMLVRDKSGSQISLIKNDFGKFIRMNAIAAYQKERQKLSDLHKRQRELENEMRDHPDIQPLMKKRDRLMRGIGPQKRLVESLEEGSPEREKEQANLDSWFEKTNQIVEEINNHPTKKHYDRLENSLNYQVNVLLEKSNDLIRDEIFKYQTDKGNIEVIQDNGGREMKGYPNECPPDVQDRIINLLDQFIPGNGKGKYTLGIHVDPYEKSRSCCREDVIFLYNGKENKDHVIIHEFGHVLEHQTGTIKFNANNFLKYRTETEELRPLKEVSENYDDDEYYRRDEFADPYCGKDYGRYGSTELISMGLQKLYEDPGKFAMEDGEYFDMIMCCLHDQEWQIDGYRT